MNHLIRHLVFLSLISVSALTIHAADLRDLDSLNGKWIPFKAELGGQPMPDAVLKTISLTLADGTYVAYVDDKPDKGTYKIDTSSKPKSMSITGTEGPNIGKTFPAIYELKGNTLRICYDLSGKKRPVTFKTVAGTKLYLVTYNREK